MPQYTQESDVRGSRIVDAARELLSALFDAWTNDDIEAIEFARATLRAMEGDTLGGKTVTGWPGSIEQQSNVLQSVQIIIDESFS